jgi:hypothetical protein
MIALLASLSLAHAEAVTDMPLLLPVRSAIVVGSEIALEAHDLTPRRGMLLAGGNRGGTLSLLRWHLGGGESEEIRRRRARHVCAPAPDSSWNTDYRLTPFTPDGGLGASVSGFVLVDGDPSAGVFVPMTDGDSVEERHVTFDGRDVVESLTIHHAGSVLRYQRKHGSLTLCYAGSGAE